MKYIIRKSSVICNPDFSEPRTGKLFYAGIDIRKTNEDLARAVYEAIMCAESVVDSVEIKKSLDRNVFDVSEKLKERCHNYYPSIDHYCCSVKAVSVKDINELLKEYDK